MKEGKMLKKIAVVAVTILAACAAQVSRSEHKLSTSGACMGDAFGGALNCTANDVSVSDCFEITTLGGEPLTSCTEGERLSFRAKCRVLANASKRYDARFDFAVDGQATAERGTCAVNTIDPFDPLTGLGSVNYVSLEDQPDVCGDINTANNPQVVSIQVDDVLCKAGEDGLLSLPVITSWDNAASKPEDACTNANGALPGTTAKCNRQDAFTVDIEVRPPEGVVAKAHAGHECSTETYVVTVSNTGIREATPACTDSTYGNFTTTHGDLAAVLTTRSGVAVVRTDCAGTPIPAGGSTSCTFTGLFCGSSEVDRITCTLTDETGSVVRQSGELTVTVTSSSTTVP